MNEPIKLKDWEVIACTYNDTRRLSGALVSPTTYGRRLRPAGTEIVTSAIQSSDHRTVNTVNSIYELVGGPSESYANWCAKRGIVIDPEQPVKVLECPCHTPD